ncbi:MAG: L-seryl-tRNA(Sec) selenium transferase [Planctomycetes bacterium ADurb.Bin126]|nr:MAG: L-seryl-tRNA(Sec) selenium transferase [Planctomycetes bacterium ADurb.Bin126]HOD81085.1 L-seryl-tRNA(Sec) selenium transferase [Phycisphaerae bacterium]HQL73665.1 L-seryl-tRNA(Sec) selenium transferase [Phycisphaerae bacterium]
MTANPHQDLLRKLPSVSQLLERAQAEQWLDSAPRPLVTNCLRDALDDLRKQILADTVGRCGGMHVTSEYVLLRARELLQQRSEFHVRRAINATGIILHTGLGRAVWPECVVDSMIDELKGYVTLAIDRESGLRSDRDHRLEYILTELTGAEAATLANNNAAATLLVLAALCAGKEVIVSRGQLIEIGGAFRLPDVMVQSGCKMVEVGTTNRTHLRDYAAAITENTAAILRVHPSNYRILGFASQPELGELVELAHSKGLVLIDDLGAGALVDLAQFGLPREPLMSDSVAAGADIVLASGDKLMGASQAGVIVGRKPLIQRCRKHPLARAFRVDKTCLMALERTLHLFRDVELLKKHHPTYIMLGWTVEQLQARADRLAAAIRAAAPNVQVDVVQGPAYLGSGSLPMEALPSRQVRLTAPNLKTADLARRLRLDDACVFGRIESDALLLDVRTMTDMQVEPVAAAVGRVVPA